MSNIIVSFVNEVLVVDSRLIADQLGIEHSNGLLRTIRKHEDDFQELGVLVFETQKPFEGSLGGRPETFCYLNEDQAYYAVTLSRNTEEARKCKMNLVRAFAETRRRENNNDQVVALLLDQQTAINNQQKTIENIQLQNQLLLADKSEAEEIGTLIKAEYKGLVDLIDVTFGNISDYYAEKIDQLYPTKENNYYTLREVAEKFLDLNETEQHDLVCKARCNINGIYHNLTGKYLTCRKMVYIFGRDNVLFALWKLVLAAKEFSIDLGVKFAVEKEVEELERLFNQRQEDF